MKCYVLTKIQYMSYLFSKNSYIVKYKIIRGIYLHDSGGELPEINISEIGLQEARRVYDSEEKRTASLESKAASLFGLVTLVVSILIFILNNLLTTTTNPVIYEILIFNIFGIIITSLSLIWLVNALWIRKVEVPFIYNPNTIFAKCSQCEDILKEDLVDNYRLATPKLYEVNQMKAKSFHWGLLFLLSGFAISISSLLLFLCYNYL